MKKEEEEEKEEEEDEDDDKKKDKKDKKKDKEKEKKHRKEKKAEESEKEEEKQEEEEKEEDTKEDSQTQPDVVTETHAPLQPVFYPLSFSLEVSTNRVVVTPRLHDLPSMKLVCMLILHNMATPSPFTLTHKLDVIGQTLSQAEGARTFSLLTSDIHAVKSVLCYGKTDEYHFYGPKEQPVEVKEAPAPEISIKPIEITPVSIEIYLKTTIETRVWCKLEDSKSELSVEAIKTGQQRYVPERVTLFFSDLLPATEYGVWCYAETKDGVPMKEKPKEKVLFVTTDVSGHSIFV